MWDMMLKGGPVMWPILGGSIIAVAIFFEKIYSLQKNKVIPLEFFQKVLSLLKEGKVSEAKSVCELETSSLGKICLASVENYGGKRSEIKAIFEEVGRQEGQKLSTLTGVIGIIASISPLLGLLGTVLGMIKVFQVISVEGVGNAASLSGGISEALLTTAFGLTVAIPALIMYKYIKSKVDQLLGIMESKAVLLLDAIKSKE